MSLSGVTEKEGFFSLNDRISDILSVPEGKELFMAMMSNGSKAKPGAFEMKPEGPMMDMLGGFTVLRLAGMIGTMGVNLTKDDLLNMNARLNQIRKPE